MAVGGVWIPVERDPSQAKAIATAIPKRETARYRPASRRESQQPAPKDGNPAAADRGSIAGKSLRPRHAMSPASLGRVR